MFLRLFDGHPQVLVHPAPMSFRWPNKTTIDCLKNSFSLAKFNETGFAKTSSLREQQPVAIEFDEELRQEILQDADIQTPRDLFNAANTAYFNAWKNRQNRSADIRYMALHTTFWSYTPAVKAMERFFKFYPDGWTIFIARPPADWLASGMKMLPGRLGDPEVALNEYVESYSKLLEATELSGVDGKAIVLEFNKLVQKPADVLKVLCERIGISYNSVLETTTINGVSIGPNSSHGGDVRYAPDPALIGHGRKILDKVKGLDRYAEAERVFDRVCALA